MIERQGVLLAVGRIRFVRHDNVDGIVRGAHGGAGGVEGQCGVARIERGVPLVGARPVLVGSPDIGRTHLRGGGTPDLRLGAGGAGSGDDIERAEVRGGHLRGFRGDLHRKARGGKGNKVRIYVSCTGRGRFLTPHGHQRSCCEKSEKIDRLFHTYRKKYKSIQKKRVAISLSAFSHPIFRKKLGRPGKGYLPTANIDKKFYLQKKYQQNRKKFLI